MRKLATAMRRWAAGLTPLRVILLGVAFAATAMFAVRMLVEPWPKFAFSFFDSTSYLKVAKIGPFRPRFYFAERPIGFPLFVWIFRNSAKWTAVGQTALYVVSVWALCWVVVRDMRSKPISMLGVLFVAGIVAEPRMSMWPPLMLSETLSNSFALLSIAAWWRVATRPSTRSVSWAWAMTIAWVLVRDPNVLPTMTVIVPAALAYWLFARRRDIDRALTLRLVGGAVLMTVVCGYVYVAQAASRRTQYSIHNTVGVRVLRDPELTKWFVDNGLPLDDELRRQEWRNSWDANERFLKAPELANYRKWARGKGSRLLVWMMVAKAPYWWDHFYADLPVLLKNEKILEEMYDHQNVWERLPSHAPPPFGQPRTRAGLWLLLALTASGLVALALDRRRRLLALVLSVGLLSAFVDVWAAYTGDPLEVSRHLVGPLGRMCIVAVVAVTAGADALWARVHPDAEPDAEQLVLFS